MILLTAIAAALQPKAIIVGAAVWIGVSNEGSATLRACVAFVGEEYGREGKFNSDVHACRSDEQFVTLRTGDSYLFLYSRTGRQSSRYSLDVYVLESAGSPSRVAMNVNTSTKLQGTGHPKAQALKVAGADNQIILENVSHSPLAIATDANGCTDGDRSKMLLLGHSQIALSSKLVLDKIALFDPAEPCKRIGAATIRRRQSD